MEQISRIGMDTSKHFFQLHGVNAAETVVLRKKLRRKEMMAFFKALAPTVIGIEACGASHHWARRLRSFGHEVKLIVPQLAKPYVKRGKNDAADAEGLCEAISRPTMRFVLVKTPEQQAALMLIGVRDRLIRNRTQLTNAIRGYAAEFGLTTAKGKAHLDPLLEDLQADENLPILARELFAAQASEYLQLQARIDKIEAKLMAWQKADECSRRLVKLPGVSPINAALLSMKTPAPGLFPNGSTIRGLDRLDTEGSFNHWRGPARCYHAGWRRSLAERAGGRSHLRDSSGSDQRQGVALPRGASQAQAGKAGRCSAGQQDGPRRLEADGHGPELCHQIGPAAAAAAA